MTFSDANNDKPKPRELVTQSHILIQCCITQLLLNREKTEEKTKTKQTDKYITKKDNRLEMDYIFSS